VWTGDIATGQDALAADRYGPIDRIWSDAAAVIITNPPWSRPAMHALIAHFGRIAPTSREGFTKRRAFASLAALIRSGGRAMPKAYSGDLRECGYASSARPVLSQGLGSRLRPTGVSLSGRLTVAKRSV
jgi:hypothetical protein